MISKESESRKVRASSRPGTCPLRPGFLCAALPKVNYSGEVRGHYLATMGTPWARLTQHITGDQGFAVLLLLPIPSRAQGGPVCAPLCSQGCGFPILNI